MKLLNDTRQDIITALDEAKKFIMERYSDYPLLADDLKISFKLKNDDIVLSPYNSMEYILTENGFCDSAALAREKAEFECMNDWAEYMNSYLSRICYWKIICSEKPNKEIQNKIELLQRQYDMLLSFDEIVRNRKHGIYTWCKSEKEEDHMNFTASIIFNDDYYFKDGQLCYGCLKEIMRF